MPFIKKSKRDNIDPFLNDLLHEIKNDAPAISYVILRLMINGFDNNIEGYIKAIGTVEETKLAFFRMQMGAIEDSILLRRWLNPDGDWKPE